MSLWAKASGAAIQLVAKAMSGPSFMANAVKTASLSVTQALAEMWRMGIADDIRQLKQDGLRRSRAKVVGDEAKARKLVAEACEAENKATLAKRNDRISRAEERLRLAEAEKLGAEAAAIRAKAEADRIAAIADAKVRLIQAISTLRERGGTFGINPNELED
jgi:hypothetical protein